MGSAKTKPKPEARDPRLDGLRELLDDLRSRKPGRFVWMRLMFSHVIFGKGGTFAQRADRYNAACAVAAADRRLRKRYGVRLRVSDDAVLRVIELANPPSGPARSPAEVVRHRIEEPAERLVRSGKVKRGGVIGVDRHPLGVRLRVGTLRPTP